MASDNPTTIDDRAAWIILERFRHHRGLTGYLSEIVQQEDIACMKGALEELRLTEVVRYVAD